MQNIEHAVTHYTQRFNWDCGISCVIMVLDKEQSQDLLKNLDKICTEEGFGKFTWSIDLCYLLKRYDIKHCMNTIVLGVNKEYSKQSYYNNNDICMHTIRVQQRFDDAESHGITVMKGSVSSDDIISHLYAHGPVIVLVDAGLLVCDLCKHNKLKYEFRRCFGGSYTGHYVLLTGYSPKTGKMLYRNPAFSPRICAVTVHMLDTARRSLGTDEDIIFVYKKFNKTKNCIND